MLGKEAIRGFRLQLARISLRPGVVLDQLAESLPDANGYAAESMTFTATKARIKQPSICLLALAAH